MALRINNDLATSFTRNKLEGSNQALTATLERLSSGRRLNKAADDAASLTIATGLESQARGLGQAMRNANDAISIAQVADSALGQTAELVTTIRTKAIQAAQDGQSSESRQALQADINQALTALNDIGRNTTYNGKQLLAGDFTNQSFQVGAAPGQTVTLSIAAANADTLGNEETGTLGGINVLTQEGAQAAIATADAALGQINANRAEIGSAQNQLASTINNLATTEINLQAANSALADTDLAEEAMNLARMKTLTQAQTFALAQSKNVKKESVLSLLQG